MPRTLLLLLFLLVTSQAWGQEARFVPIESGRTWTYEGVMAAGMTRPMTLTLAVTGTDVRDGETYHAIEMKLRDHLGGTLQQSTLYWRLTDAGLHWLGYDGAAKTDDMFFRYPADEGLLYTLALTSSAADVPVGVRRESVTVPAGAFDAVVYQTRQPMEGMYQQYVFAPGTGLVKIAGVDAETGREVFAFRLKKD